MLSGSLHHLRLGGNLLSGCYLVRLIICVYILYMAYLELNNNQIVASIPSQLGKCNSLNILDLSSNKLEGQAWCSGESCLTESSGRGFEAASP